MMFQYKYIIYTPEPVTLNLKYIQILARKLEKRRSLQTSMYKYVNNNEKYLTGIRYRKSN